MAYAKKHNESSSVVACIRRKASRLGCPFNSEKKKKDEVSPIGQYDLDYFDHFEDDEMAQLFRGLQAAFEERKLDSICEEVDESRIQELEQAVEDAKKDQDSVLQQRLEAARKEIRYLHSDIENLTNSVADAVEEVRDLRIQRIADLRALTGETFDFQTISDELKSKDSGEIKGTLEDLSGKVDMQKITDTLNSGLSNNPTGTVEDPTLAQDNTTKPEEKEGGEEIPKEFRKRARLEYMKIYKHHGKKEAEKWIKDMYTANKVPGKDES
jgi:hypothetical protein